MGRVAAGVLTANVAMAAGQKVVAMLRDEYDRLIERQGKAAGAQVGLAAAQEQAAFNLGQDPSLTAKQLFDTVRSESQRLGMSERDLTMAVSDALSARGDADAKTAVEAVTAAAELRRFNPSELPGLSASALDISKGTGLDLKSSLGFLLQTGTLSRVTDMEKLSKNVAPAVIGGMQFGASREFSGGLTAALTQGIVDPTGESSRTTSVQLMKQMREFGTAENLGGVEETFKRLQTDAELRKSFFADASFESKALPAVEALFQQGSAVANQMAAAQQSLATQNPLQRFNDTVAQRDAMPAAQVAIAQQQMASMSEQIALSDPKQAISGVVREGLKEARAALGASGVGSRITGIMEDLGSGGQQDIGTAIQGIQNERAAIMRKAAPREVPSFNGTTFRTMPGTPLTAEDRKAVALLDQMVKRLESLDKQIQAVGQQPAAPGLMVPKAPAAAPAGDDLRMTGGQRLPAVEVKLPAAQMPLKSAALPVAAERPAVGMQPAAQLPADLPESRNSRPADQPGQSGAGGVAGAAPAALPAVPWSANDSQAVAMLGTMVARLESIDKKLTGQNSGQQLNRQAGVVANRMALQGER